MSVPNVALSYVFGVNSTVQNNAFFVDDITVMYPVGYQIVLYNIEKRTQKIHHLQLDGDKISCMAIKRPENLVIIGTIASKESAAFVASFDILTGKKKKFYRTGDNTREIISVSFSADGRYVFGQGSGPEWNLYAWTAEKGKLFTSCKSTSGQLEIRKISNHHESSTNMIAVSGVSLFRLFRFQDGFLKLFHQIKIENDIICHTWIDESIVACGTSSGKIMLFNGGEMMAEVQYFPNLSEEDVGINVHELPAVTALASFQGGLFVGLDNGVLVYYEKMDENPFFRKKREEKFESSDIVNISWNSREDRALVTTKSNQIYVFQIEAEQKGETIKYDRLSHSFHDGAILAIDGCVSKPLLATSGSDKSIRLWNYTDNVLEIISYFEEVATSIAIHPNGLYLLAACPSGLKLMAILIDTFKVNWETPLIKSAKACKFSNGGQYFAVITAINVTIFNTWSFEVIAIIKGASGRIQGIHWNEDDSRLITYFSDGTIQHWSAFGFTKISETNYESAITSCTINASSTTSYLLSVDGQIREVINGVVNRSYKPNDYLMQVLLSSSGTMLFQTTESGRLKAVKFPYNPEGPLTDDTTDFCYSDVPIKQIQFSHNCRYLFSAGEDGVLWIHKIQEKDKKKDKDWEATDEILVQKSDLRENFKYLNELRKKVEEIKIQGEASILVKTDSQDAKLSEMRAQQTKDIAVIQAMIDKSKSETEILISENKEAFEKFRSENKHESDELRSSYVKKIEVEQARVASLVEKKKTLEEQWQARIKSIQISHKNDSADLQTFFSKQIEDKTALIQKTQKDAIQTREKFESHLIDVEKDIEQESLEITHSFESKLKEERSLYSSVQDDNESMKVTFINLQQQIEGGKIELTNCVIQNRKLGAVIKALENDVLGLKSEIRERDETVIDKEKRILDLKKKNQELEKFKFVLDYKIIELRKQEEPRENDMISLHRNLKLMSDEVKDICKQKIELNQQYQDLLMKNYGALHHRVAEKWKSQQIQLLIDEFNKDIFQASNESKDRQGLKRATLKLFQKYQDFSDQIPVPPPDVYPVYSESELLVALHSKEAFKFEAPKCSDSNNRGRRQLEKTVQILKKEASKTLKKRAKDTAKIIGESTFLTKEINTMRRDLVDKKNRIVEMEIAFEKGTRLSQFIRDKVGTKATDMALIKHNNHGNPDKDLNALPPIDGAVAK